MPHTLSFVDMSSPDPKASGGAFYREVLGWTIEPRCEEGFQRIVPGGELPGHDGEPSGVGNLHLGIHDSVRPVPPQRPARTGRGPSARSAHAPCTSW